MNGEQKNGTTPDESKASKSEKTGMKIPEEILKSKEDVPLSPKIKTIVSESSPEDVIQQNNNLVKTVLDVSELLRTYCETEKARFESQKSLLDKIPSMARLLLIWFNVFASVAGLAIAGLCFVLQESQLMVHLIELAKYYIGAVLVEIVGLVSIIVVSVFTGRHYNVVEKILDKFNITDK